ncbi:MAG: hypothetical protein KZQ63_21475, partial [Candidatus Thiodiazotropha sp. (ex Lucinoma aequizonata)]|nr:hypothetical protein [Candidatus Thiodiazotropha sp. (ex Lucinoma aequizonata)]
MAFAGHTGPCRFSGWFGSCFSSGLVLTAAFSLLFLFFLLPQYRAKALDVTRHDRQGNLTFEAVYAV